MPDSPLLFISHKHSDAHIAQVVAEFIEAKSNGRVKVHLSSNPDFDGPKFGKNLNTQLRETLWHTNVLILIYTSPDQDWSYCMWECGVANDSQSPDTNIIVFQCGSIAPTLFAADLRVNARIYEDIKRFTDQFLRDPKFFSKDVGAIAPDLKDVYVETAAKELYQNLGSVLPPPDDGSDDWPAWPYLQIELPRLEVERLEQAGESERVKLAHQIVTDHGIVVGSDPRAAQLFGQASLSQRMKFGTLLKAWKDKSPNTDTAWFDSCCEQIMMGAGRGFPVIRWTPIKAVGGDAGFTPVLSRIRRMPFDGSVLFDLYFYDLSDPRGVAATSRMTPLTELFFKTLGDVDPRALKLLDLVKELDLRRLNRLPVLNADGHPMYIIHRSMVDKFIVSQFVSATGGAGPQDLTLADLLADQEMKRIFESTFVVVSAQSTLAEAKSAMLTRTGCSDVFVTARGGQDEPVQGWLSNVDIARNA